MLCIVVSFLVIPKLTLGLFHAVWWVRNNSGCLSVAKEGRPDTLVHRCSFLAKTRENDNIISFVNQSRQELAHPHKTRLLLKPRHFLLRSGQVLILPDFKVFPGEMTHDK